MKNAIKYVYDVNPFYVHWKRHFCPKCGNKLELRYASRIINSKSPEATDYDFSVGDTFLLEMLSLEQDIFIVRTVNLTFRLKK